MSGLENLPLALMDWTATVYAWSGWTPLPSAAVVVALRTFSPISVAPSQTETSCQATLESEAGVQLTLIVELRPVVCRLAGGGSVGSMSFFSPGGTTGAADAGSPTSPPMLPRAACPAGVGLGTPPGGLALKRSVATRTPTTAATQSAARSGSSPSRRTRAGRARAGGWGPGPASGCGRGSPGCDRLFISHLLSKLV